MSDNAKERTRVLDEIRRLTAEAGGQVPGQRRFLKETGLKRSLWQGEIWTTFSAAVQEAGFSPNSFAESFSEDKFLRPLAMLARDKKRFPTTIRDQVRGKPRSARSIPGRLHEAFWKYSGLGLRPSSLVRKGRRVHGRS